MGYTWIGEAAQFMSAPFPAEAWNPALPGRSSWTSQGLDRVVIFEETEPFVEGLCKRIFQEEKIGVEVLGRSGFLPSDGELSLAAVLDGIEKAAPKVKVKKPETPAMDIHVPIRTRTQCVGCNYRGILNALKQTFEAQEWLATLAATMPAPSALAPVHHLLHGLVGSHTAEWSFPLNRPSSLSLGIPPSSQRHPGADQRGQQQDQRQRNPGEIQSRP
jgi:hypothetical protein